MVVRGEELTPIPDDKSLDESRLLPSPIEEVTSMSDLGRRCRESDTHALFLTCMKRYEN